MRRLVLAVLVVWAGAARAEEHAAPASASKPTANATPTPTPTSTPAATSTSTATAATSAVSRAESYTPGKGPAAIPPSLTANALTDELRRTSRERRAEKASLAEERVRLEKLEQEIATARAALREETKKLQELIASGGARPKRGKAAKPGKKGDAQPSPLGDLARTVKGMRPEAAAALLAKLDRSLAAAILEQMRAADAAAVVEKMEPGTGAALFALLARSTP
jgi:flagellar motility protein MotE (MotC chaperone)